MVEYDPDHNQVSIKQVQLTQFWHMILDFIRQKLVEFQSSKSNLLNSDMVDVISTASITPRFNQASPTYSILTESLF